MATSTEPGTVASVSVGATSGLAHAINEELRTELKNIHTKLDELKGLVKDGSPRTSRFGSFTPISERGIDRSSSRIPTATSNSPGALYAPRRRSRTNTSSSNNSGPMTLKDLLGPSSMRSSSRRPTTESTNGPFSELNWINLVRRNSRSQSSGSKLSAIQPVPLDHIESEGSGLSCSDEQHTAVIGRAMCRQSTIKQRSAVSDKILTVVWNVLEVPESGKVAYALSVAMPWFIILTVCVTLLQSVDAFNFNGVAAAAVETTIDSICLIEFLLRFIACPNHYTFFLSVFNIIDFAAAIPLFVRASAGFVLSNYHVDSWASGILFCAVPWLRLLKLLRRFEKFHLLLNAFNLAAEALPVIFFILAVITLFFTMLIYLVEPSDNIGSLPLAAWLTIVTMSTVGYGDYSPKTTAGTTITSVLIVVSVLYTAIPLGIVGNAFTETWKDRDRILLTIKTRDRLKQWGYTAEDIPELFNMSDTSSDGTLTVDEFANLLKQMQLGFNDARIFQLFNLFDPDGDGTVDERKFVKTLFPHAYSQIYSGYGSEGAQNPYSEITIQQTNESITCT